MTTLAITTANEMVDKHISSLERNEYYNNFRRLAINIRGMEQALKEATNIIEQWSTDAEFISFYTEVKEEISMILDLERRKRDME